MKTKELTNQDKLDLIIGQKRAIETELSILKNKIRTSGQMPKQAYKNLCKKQDYYKRQIIELQPQINYLKKQLRDSNNEINVYYSSKYSRSYSLNEMIGFAEKYLEQFLKPII